MASNKKKKEKNNHEKLKNKSGFAFLARNAVMNDPNKNEIANIKSIQTSRIQFKFIILIIL